MNADRSDAPSYMQPRNSLSEILRWGLALGLASGISVGALYIASQQLYTPLPSTQPKTESYGKPLQQVQSSEPVRITNTVDPTAPNKHTYRPNPVQESTPIDNVPPKKATKQTVFNDHNYTPKPLVNSVSMGQPVENTARRPEGVVVGIKEKRSPCWPYKEGSIEYRDCKRSVQLNARNR